MNLLAHDTETFLIRPDCPAPPIVCVSWATSEENAGIFKWDGDGCPVRAPEALATWYRDYHVTLHNAPYDLCVECTSYPELIPIVFDALARGVVHDTLIREKLRDIAFGEFRWRKLPDGTNERVNYYLADVASRRLGVYMSKGEDTWRLRYGELYHVPLAWWPHDATHYAVNDSTKTIAVHLKQDEERDRILREWNVDIFADEAAQVRAGFWMGLMSCAGMPLDQTRVAALEEAITEERNALEEILIDEGLVRIEYYSPKARDVASRGQEKKRTRDAKAAQAYMAQVCSEMGIEPKMTAGGKKPKADGTFSPPSVCIDAEACEDTGDEVLEAYAHYSALGNVLGKDVRAMRGMHRIHGKFDSLVASGRTASRTQKVIIDGKEVRIGLNLQNLRVEGKTRQCFVAPPGWCFCLIDLTAAELYAVAQLCIKMFGFSRLAEVLNSNPPIDPHVLLASTVAQRPYDQVLAAVESGDPVAKNKRKVGKHCNYGLWGGMREKRFIVLVKRLTSGQKDKHGNKIPPIILTEDEAHEYRQGFLQTWPEAPAYLLNFERQCSGGKRATVVQYRSNRIRGGLHYSEACNTGFQGLIADIMKDAGFRVTREMYDWTRGSVLLGSRICNFPHDELICLVPEATAHDCAMRIQQIVLDTGKEWLPDVPPKGEVYLARYWSKKAKPVRGPDGRLVPWNGEA